MLFVSVCDHKRHQGRELSNDQIRSIINRWHETTEMVSGLGLTASYMYMEVVFFTIYTDRSMIAFTTLNVPVRASNHSGTAFQSSALDLERATASNL